MKVEHICTTFNEVLHEMWAEEKEYAGTAWRHGTEMVLICWETYSVNPSVYHPCNIYEARQLGESKMQSCKQVVLQFWKAGIMYAQQTARTAEQARNFGNKTMIYQRYW